MLVESLMTGSFNQSRLLIYPVLFTFFSCLVRRQERESYFAIPPVAIPEFSPGTTTPRLVIGESPALSGHMSKMMSCIINSMLQCAVCSVDDITTSEQQ